MVINKAPCHKRQPASRQSQKGGRFMQKNHWNAFKTRVANWVRETGGDGRTTMAQSQDGWDAIGHLFIDFKLYRSIETERVAQAHPGLNGLQRRARVLQAWSDLKQQREAAFAAMFPDPSSSSATASTSSSSLSTSSSAAPSTSSSSLSTTSSTSSS